MCTRIDTLIEVAWRVLAAVWAYLAGGLLVTVFGTVALVVSLVDLLYRLVMGDRWISGGYWAYDYASDTLMWVAETNTYVLTGNGAFNWLPAY
jgi:hypothetical protein